MRSALCVIAVVAALIPARSSGQGRAIRTESGRIEGVQDDGVTVYKGVPYAAPPVGELRWREPQRVHAWAGIRRADTYAPACMQKGVSMPGETPPTVSEDCLYLNIWTAARSASARLPVIVWVHGGGYTNGSASMPLYRGDRLARKGVIVVTIAYRLGPLGFLAHPELTSESSRHSSGNYGLMDQVAALEWVQRNIAAFGGNPGKVTIAGQSAGSMAVSMLMVSPRSVGLFQRAIGESGGVFEPTQLAPGYLLAQAERDGQHYAASLGAHSLAELRVLSASQLLAGDADMVSHPVIEPFVLPVAPYDAFAAGQQHDVPLLLGSNAEEARSLVDVKGVTAATFDGDVARSFGQLPPALLAAYSHATDASARQARLDLERDLRFGWDMWAWARLQAATGRQRVFYYSFAQRPPFPAGSVYESWGAGHFAELWYVFDHLDQARWNWTPDDRRLAAEMSGYWTNFAKSGDPNGRGLPRWPAYTGANDNVLRLGTPISIGGVESREGLGVFDVVYGGLRGASFPARR